MFLSIYFNRDVYYKGKDVHDDDLHHLWLKVGVKGQKEVEQAFNICLINLGF